MIRTTMRVRRYAATAAVMARRARMVVRIM